MNKSEAGRLGYLASKEKFDLAKLKRVSDYNLSPNLCNNCNTKLEYKHRNLKFCSKSCAAIYNNKLRRPARFCLSCGQEIDRASGKKYNKYCNLDCFRNLTWNKKKKLIENANGIGFNSRIIKKYLIEVRGHACEICHSVEWMNRPIPLVMDHIDGNPYNDALDNLRLVCGNCDMQLPTYKSKNKGNGRAYRRERYKDGKSY